MGVGLRDDRTTGRQDNWGALTADNRERKYDDYVMTRPENLEPRGDHCAASFAGYGHSALSLILFDSGEAG